MHRQVGKGQANCKVPGGVGECSEELSLSSVLQEGSLGSEVEARSPDPRIPPLQERNPLAPRRLL